MVSTTCLGVKPCAHGAVKSNCQNQEGLTPTSPPPARKAAAVRPLAKGPRPPQRPSASGFHVIAGAGAGTTLLTAPCHAVPWPATPAPDVTWRLIVRCLPAFPHQPSRGGVWGRLGGGGGFGRASLCNPIRESTEVVTHGRRGGLEGRRRSG